MVDDVLFLAGYSKNSMPLTLTRLLGFVAAMLVVIAAPDRAPAQATGEYISLRAALSQSALRPGDNVVLAVVADIKDGYHAQSNTPTNENFIAFEVAVEPNDGLVIGAPIYPPGHRQHYPALGELDTYDGRVVVFVPIRVNDSAGIAPTTLRVTVTYQICDDQTCFPPESPTLEVTSRIAPVATAVDLTEPALFQSFDPSVFANLTHATTRPSASESKQGERIFGYQLRQNAYLLAFAGAFVVGMIFNIVPCVLPVLPLKAIGFYEVAQHDRKKCLMLGLVFSLGIIATFGALAIPVLVLKAFAWGELFANPIFAGAVTLVLLVMALGMFGAFGVGLPNFVYSVTPRHDTYTGNFLFGILTAVLSTPCTFGLFFALLTWASAQPAAVGVAMLMVVGAGMAFPYLVLSALPELARKIPRAGAWSEVVKQMMAFLLLATAAYFGKMFLPDALRGPGFWWVIFALVAAAGAFLVVRAVQIAPRPRPVIIATAVALALVTPAFAFTMKLANPPLAWTYFDDAALAAAQKSGGPVLVKFTADWCANCQTVELTVFGNEETVRWLRRNGVTTIKADLTKQTAPGWPLLRSLNPVGAIPLTAVYLPGEAQPKILSGIYSSADLKAAVEGR